MDGTAAGTRQSWDEQGFAVVRGAAPTEAVQRLGADLEAAADRLLVRAPGDDYPSLAARRPGGRGGAGAVDPYVLSPAARQLLLAEPVVAFAREVLGEAPMLIAACEASSGAPDDGPYRDPTFVPIAEPDRLAGVLVALGDAALPVHGGSHTLPVELFSGRYRHVNPERDGDDALAAHRAALEAALAEHGLAEEHLDLQAGDVVVWQANLVHRGPTGSALVGHLVPSSVAPPWFGHRPDRAYRVPHGDACFTSRHYALSDAPGAVAAAPAPASAPTPLERGTPAPEIVEHELDRHDSEPGGEPGSSPHRNAGLVGRVRGMMGRRPGR